jgi:hypothetical protein
MIFFILFFFTISEMNDKRRLKNLIFPLVGGFLFFSFSCDKVEEIDRDQCVDSDGNVYRTVNIGNQEWMAENLKTTTYSDGTDIPIVIDDAEWMSLNTSAYVWPDNDENNKDQYGALYNWYAVESGKLCPSGRHVATERDWDVLRDYLGGPVVAGGND